MNLFIHAVEEKKSVAPKGRRTALSRRNKKLLEETLTSVLNAIVNMTDRNRVNKPMNHPGKLIFFSPKRFTYCKFKSIVF